jgi:putative nucleotidyltransferase with HDIG domain
MSGSSQRRTRSHLVAALAIPPGQAAQCWDRLRRRDVLWRLVLCLLAALAVLGTTGGWNPPFAYRLGDTPSRNIVVRTPFHVDDAKETEKARRRARSETLNIYENDNRPLIELRRAVRDSVFRVTSVDSPAKLDADGKQAWLEFLVEDQRRGPDLAEPSFQALHAGVAEDKDLTKFAKALEITFTAHERQGLLVALEHDLEDGSQTAILVHDVGKEGFTERVEVSSVHIGAVMANLPDQLGRALESQGLPVQQIPLISQLVTNWFASKKLPVTLRLNEAASERARREAADRVPVATREYVAGDVLATAGHPLAESDMFLLRQEYETAIATASVWDQVQRSVAALGVYLACFVFCGAYALMHEPRLLTDTRQLANILGLVVATVTLCAFDRDFQWRAEILPLILFAMTITLAYQREFALLLAACLTVIVTLSFGRGLAECMVLYSSVATSVLLLVQVRTRTRLIYIGLLAGTVVAATALSVGTLTRQTFGWSGLGLVPMDGLAELLPDFFLLRLVLGALWLGFCSLLAGVLMTGLLPFIERLFDVQTDLSLLELGDAAHPLLQQLVQRAPGTYSHSVTVGSIGQAAAEAIGANGLLVRVGAYFHDVGKMLKTDYFVENQCAGDNRHAALVPAMSTLVIIAHVKDGADLARRHHLPQSLIDFIEQHHGTTLVEYFFNRARQGNDTPQSLHVDEHSFRYPGPKPQSQETAVLMLADAAEGACRTLDDPAPARIRNLVHELTMKRLLDGQFDECGVTLKELRLIEDSLVKSLTAVYHGRVKYPSQQTA